MSRHFASIRPWRSVALVAALLVAHQAFAAPAAPAKKKPVAAAKAAGVKAQRPPIAKGKGAGTSKATAAKKPPASLSAKAAAKRPTPMVAAVAPRPEPQMYVPPPLGPERYYPNGIPELRPEFLHPLPGARPQVAVQDTGPNPFSAPQ
jgi:hypothetical protein